MTSFKNLFSLKANLIAFAGYEVGKAIGGEVGAVAEIAYNIYSTVDNIVTIADICRFGFKARKWYQIAKLFWQLYQAASNDDTANG